MTITVPTGRWLRRTDARDDRAVPTYAYGLEEGVLVVWSDGKHTVEPKGYVFPASNWELMEFE